MRTVSLPACVCLVLVFGNVRDQQRRIADDGFPSARSIAQDLGYRDIDEAYLLSFSSMVDDRPLFVESALVAVKMETGKWGLAYVYRHPREKEEGANRWRLSEVADAHQCPSREFVHRPSRDEVERFLVDSWWRFRLSASPGFRLVRDRIFSETWEKALGYRPRHQFPKPAS